MNLREKFREAIYEDLTIRQCPTADWISDWWLSALTSELEGVREKVEKLKYHEDEEDIGAEAIANHVYEDKFEAFRFGFNESVKEALAIINTSLEGIK